MCLGETFPNARDSCLYRLLTVIRVAEIAARSNVGTGRDGPVSAGAGIRTNDVASGASVAGTSDNDRQLATIKPPPVTTLDSMIRDASCPAGTSLATGIASSGVVHHEFFVAARVVVRAA